MQVSFAWNKQNIEISFILQIKTFVYTYKHTYIIYYVHLNIVFYYKLVGKLSCVVSEIFHDNMAFYNARQVIMYTLKYYYFKV